MASILGTYIGKKILEQMSEKQFKQTVLVLVLITGIISLGKVIFPSIKTYLDNWKNSHENTALPDYMAT